MQSLAGKAILLTMLLKMCHKADINQLRLSNATKLVNGNIQFILEEPCKTVHENNYRKQSGLQKLIIPHIKQNRKLCLVTASEDYLDRVKNIRGSLNEVFVLLRQPSSPAKSRTLSRWYKDILQKAGIEKHGVYSVRSAVTCGPCLEVSCWTQL